MHAASVHPEPGSNSLMFCIYSPRIPPRLIHQSDLFLLFYLFRVSFFFKRISESLHFLCFVLLFNFQWAARRPLFGTACLLYHFSTTLSIPFPKLFLPFFWFFPLYSDTAQISVRWFFALNKLWCDNCQNEARQIQFFSIASWRIPLSDV